MKKIYFVLFSVLSVTSFSQTKRILIVSTNVDSVANNVSGSYLPEIAYPFKYFTDHGFIVDVLTPDGGKAAIYSAATTKDELVQIQKSDLFISKTENTLSPEQVKATDYIAAYYPGGHGQYFDVQNDERIASIVTRIYENGGYVGSAGHGTASLINVQLSNGKYFVEGKKLTCFPWWAEKKWMNISNYGKLLPFDQQVVLARRKAILTVSTPETNNNWDLTHIVDKPNRLVTGSFASSAQWVAEEMVKMIAGK